MHWRDRGANWRRPRDARWGGAYTWREDKTPIMLLRYLTCGACQRRACVWPAFERLDVLSGHAGAQLRADEESQKNEVRGVSEGLVMDAWWWCLPVRGRGFGRGPGVVTRAGGL